MVGAYLNRVLPKITNHDSNLTGNNVDSNLIHVLSLFNGT